MDPYPLGCGPSGTSGPFLNPSRVVTNLDSSLGKSLCRYVPVLLQVHIWVLRYYTHPVP